GTARKRLAGDAGDGVDERALLLDGAALEHLDIERWHGLSSLVGPSYENRDRYGRACERAPATRRPLRRRRRRATVRRQARSRCPAADAAPHCRSAPRS